MKSPDLLRLIRKPKPTPRRNLRNERFEKEQKAISRRVFMQQTAITGGFGLLAAGFTKYVFEAIRLEVDQSHLTTEEILKLREIAAAVQQHIFNEDAQNRLRNVGTKFGNRRVHWMLGLDDPNGSFEGFWYNDMGINDEKLRDEKISNDGEVHQTIAHESIHALDYWDYIDREKFKNLYNQLDTWGGEWGEIKQDIEYILETAEHYKNNSDAASWAERMAFFFTFMFRGSIEMPYLQELINVFGPICQDGLLEDKEAQDAIFTNLHEELTRIRSEFPVDSDFYLPK
jgi:hypothetical protein